MPETAAADDVRIPQHLEAHAAVVAEQQAVTHGGHARG
jgi:hypothetical protein